MGTRFTFMTCLSILVRTVGPGGGRGRRSASETFQSCTRGQRNTNLLDIKSSRGSMGLELLISETTQGFELAARVVETSRSSLTGKTRYLTRCVFPPPGHRGPNKDKRKALIKPTEPAQVGKLIAARRGQESSGTTLTLNPISPKPWL